MRWNTDRLKRVFRSDMPSVHEVGFDGADEGLSATKQATQSVTCVGIRIGFRSDMPFVYEVGFDGADEELSATEQATLSVKCGAILIG